MTSASILKKISQIPKLSGWLADKVWDDGFDVRTLARAKPYASDGSIQSPSLSQERDGIIRIEAKVTGTHIYNCELLLVPAKPRDHDFKIEECYCSCPVSFSCKHAAAILHWLSALASERNPPNFQLELLDSPPPTSLNPEASQWLRRMHNTQFQDAPPVTKPTQTVLTFCVEQSDLDDSRWLLRLRPANVLKDGTVRIKPSNAQIGKGALPQYISAEDTPHALIYWSFLERMGNWQEPKVQGPFLSQVLDYALQQERLYFKTRGEHAPYYLLTAGPHSEASLAWQQDSDGSSHPIVKLSKEEQCLLPTTPPLYIDPQSKQLGAVQSQISTEIMAAWQEGPAISPEETTLVAQELAQNQETPHQAFPSPKELKIEDIPSEHLTPILRIRSKVLHRWGAEEFILASLHFRYLDSPAFLPLSNKAPLLTRWTSGDTLKTVTRNRTKEREFEKDLQRLELERVCDLFQSNTIKPEFSRAFLLLPDSNTPALQWLIWIDDHRSALEAQGWTIEIDPESGLLLHDLGDFQFDLGEAPAHGIDWFEFNLTGDLDGNQVNLIPYIADFLSQGYGDLEPEDLPEFFVLAHPEHENQFIRFPSDRFLEICQNVAHLFQGKANLADGPLTIDRLTAAGLAHELAIDGTQTSKALAKLGKKLSSITELPAKSPPKDFQANLRPYQLDGFRWLHFLSQHGLNGILADDMGLGKTVQTLAFLSTLPRTKKSLPSLIVAPTSVIANWSLEAERFTPKLKTLLLQGPERKELFPQIPHYNLILTSYPLLHRDSEVLLAQDWQAVILDEAQYIKNPKTNAAEVSCKLKSKHRFCLSGTPMENHLGELWSLMRFAMPGYLGDQKTFTRDIRRPIENEQDATAQRSLSRRLAPLLLRRTKDEVAQDLPEKTELIHHVTLSKKESDLYESIRATMDKRVREALAAKGLAKSHIIILDALLKLRQVCCHPTLLKTPAAQKFTKGSKMDFLTERLLPELLSEGRRILLFSQFTSVLSIIEKHLNDQNIPHLKLTGQTQNRAQLVKTWQTEDIPIFLISLKAGGTGLTLTAADTVIHYDPWWNPATENQATDRAHRIGQTKPVFVHKLICQGSIEDRILTLQEHKANLVKSLLSAETSKLKINPETLSQLFEPLSPETK